MRNSPKSLPEHQGVAGGVEFNNFLTALLQQTNEKSLFTNAKKCNAYIFFKPPFIVFYKNTVPLKLGLVGHGGSHL